MLSDRCLSVCPVLSVCDVGVLWPNGWTDQDETWHAGRPRPWPHSVRWGPSSTPPKGHIPPKFLPISGWMDQDATRYGGRPQTRSHCGRWGPSSLSPKRGHNPQIFSPCLLCPNGWMDQDATGMEVGFGPSHIVLYGDPTPPPQKKRGEGHSSPHFSAHVYCGQTIGIGHLSNC